MNVLTASLMIGVVNYVVVGLIGGIVFDWATGASAFASIVVGIAIGLAVALLDFDFAAPGRRTFDLAAFARMCVPVDDDTNAARLGWGPADRPRRLRLVCDTYGLDRGGRAEVLASVSAAIAAGGEFVRRHVEAGDPGFVQMWHDMGGMERFDRRRRWWEERKPDFEAALR